jgi:RNA polymerase sigma factor (sigma-70 family)
VSIESLYKECKAPLFSLAYRMLGSVMDAEDVVQEAFLSFDQLPDTYVVQNERAYLYKIVTNRCLDLLRSSAKKREMYVGPWLPEPLIDKGGLETDPSAAYLQRESISTAYLLLLQQLNAVERAVFLLREIFQYSFDEIAEMVGKSSANCRQIFHRAKKSIQFDPEQNPPISIAGEIVKDFVLSLSQGNRNKLLELVSENVVYYSDGGGKARVARIPITGFDQVIEFLRNLLGMYKGKITHSFLSVNGLPGIQIIVEDIQFIYSFAFHNNKIQTIYNVANPEKLRHVKGD